MKRNFIKLILILLIAFSFNKTYSQEKIIDKVIATVGSNIILYSDIETQYLQFQMQGYSQKDGIRCQIFEEILFQKLLLNQAEIDSTVITDEQVESEMDRRLRYFISQIGSEEKLEEYYSKTIIEIKEEMRTLIREQLLVDNVQKTITSEVKITPAEVKAYFKNIHPDSLPLISSEIKIAQIVKQPTISKAEIESVKNKLNQLRERIIKGEKFSVLARLYSEDPGSASKGGETGLFTKGIMQAEFEVAAFGLEENEVSPIIETKFGFHILQLIERRGDYINVKHILMQTKVSPVELNKAKNFLDSVATLINNDSMTFEKAATLFSDDPSKNNFGLVINQATLNAKFSPDELDPNIFFVVDKLKVGEISKPAIMKTEDSKQAYRLLCLKSRTEPHKASLKKDYNKIQESALQEKQNKAIEKWISEKTKDTYIYILDKEFKNCKFKYNWAN